MGPTVSRAEGVEAKAETHRTCPCPYTVSSTFCRWLTKRKRHLIALFLPLCSALCASPGSCKPPCMPARSSSCFHRRQLPAVRQSVTSITKCHQLGQTKDQQWALLRQGVKSSSKVRLTHIRGVCYCNVGELIDCRLAEVAADLLKQILESVGC